MDLRGARSDAGRPQRRRTGVPQLAALVGHLLLKLCDHQNTTIGQEQPTQLIVLLILLLLRGRRLLLVAGALRYFAFGSDVGLRDDVWFFRFIWHMRLLCAHSGVRPARTSYNRRHSFRDRWGRIDGGQARASYCYRHRLYPQ